MNKVFVYFCIAFLLAQTVALTVTNDVNTTIFTPESDGEDAFSVSGRAGIPSGDWTFSTLDSTGNVGRDSSLAIDSNDNLHVTYRDNTNNNLEYMSYDGTNGWSTPVSLDSTDDVGHYSSLAIDSNDNLHVTYFDNTNQNLEYMTYDVSASSWSTSLTIDNSTDTVGQYSSLAIDSNDNLHVTYYDGTNGDLEYMFYMAPLQTWSSSSSIDSTNDVGFHSSLAIDSNDNLHVAYIDKTNENLRYMTFNGQTGGWSNSISLDSIGNLGWEPSLVIDSNDNLHVTYRDSSNYNLKYITYDNSTSSWNSPATIDSIDQVGYMSSLAIDSNDNLYVTYYDWSNGNLEYMNYDGSNWSTPVSLDNSTTGNSSILGLLPSLAIDSNDNLHVTYFDDTNGDLKYGEFAVSASPWTFSTLDSTDNVGMSSSLAIDSNGNLHVTYYDYTNGNLEYVAYDGSYWNSPATLDSTGNVGQDSSLAIDSSDNLHVTYYDVTNGNLEYMAFNGSSWSTPLTLDSTDNVGQDSSLAIDSSDNLHVTYYDVTNGNLEYINYDRASNGWSTPVTPDSTDNVGYESSLAIDSSDHLHVTYLDATNGNLEYMNYDASTSSWSTPQTLDSTYSVGSGSSLAIDSNDNLHVTYYDWSHGNLEYMNYDGASNGWSTPLTLDSTDNVGTHSSLAIDSSDHLHVTYLDATNGNLEYMNYDGASNGWSTPVSLDNSATDNSSQIGKWPSLAIDSNDNLRVTYYDETNSDLRYGNFATSGNGIDSDGDGIDDSLDSCPNGNTNWVSSSSTDYDSDGCQDASEDMDDDNDGVHDSNDSCSAGALGWISTSATDNDGDGCKDSTEDMDDDNDGITDGSDNCQFDANPNQNNYDANYESAGSHEGDACDLDDDNDGVLDTNDDCDTGVLGWTSVAATDHDSDGCKDSSSEDSDDDNDGVSDVADDCPTGDLGWTSTTSNDADADGCRDLTEDPDGGGSWTMEVIESSRKEGFGSSMAIDDEGNIHVSYYDYENSGQMQLKYAYYDGNWSTYTLDYPIGSVGSISTDLKLDGEGCPHILYQTDGEKLVLTRSAPGGLMSAAPCTFGNAMISPSPLTIAENLSATTIIYSLALEGSGNNTEYHVAYTFYCETCSNWDGDLHYWNLNNDGIYVVTIATSTLTGFNSIKLDDNGNPHIAYYDADAKIVYYKYFNGQSWTTETIDNDVNLLGTGSILSLDLGPNWQNTASVAYVEANDSMLKLAVRSGGSWSVTSIADTNGGADNSLAFDENDYPTIAFTEGGMSTSDSNTLKFAHYNGQEWIVETIDNGGNGEHRVGINPSLVYDHNGKPIVSHLDLTTGNLKFTCNGCSVFNGGSSGSGTDADGDGVINSMDNCPNGESDWTSTSTGPDLITDWDSDGCQDSSEDSDDDNDGVSDSSDSCATGDLGWTSSSLTDHDLDGCQDSAEDSDDDNDGKPDVEQTAGYGDDNCPKGDLGWTSSTSTDYDGDGCQDAQEDDDDDDDWIEDANDSCRFSSTLDWNTDEVGEDFDHDGCRDSNEDDDDDGDGVLDANDSCLETRRGAEVDLDGCETSFTDTDGDGVADSVDECENTESGTVVYWDGCPEENDSGDEDGDGIQDSNDNCYDGRTDWTSSSTNDYDSDGCQDSTEDWDDDNDGIGDEDDMCPTGSLNWDAFDSSNPDNDYDGCRDSDEDDDDDDDSFADALDTCPLSRRGAVVDETGCETSFPDDDGDGVSNDYDDCENTENGTQVDWNGCEPWQDQDNDGVRDSEDDCPNTTEGDQVDANGCTSTNPNNDGSPEIFAHLTQMSDNDLDVDYTVANLSSSESYSVHWQLWSCGDNDLQNTMILPDQNFGSGLQPSPFNISSSEEGENEMENGYRLVMLTESQHPFDTYCLQVTLFENGVPDIEVSNDTRIIQTTDQRDTDGDGVSNSEDDCPESILSDGEVDVNGCFIDSSGDNPEEDFLKDDWYSDIPIIGALIEQAKSKYGKYAGVSVLSITVLGYLYRGATMRSEYKMNKRVTKFKKRINKAQNPRELRQIQADLERAEDKKLLPRGALGDLLSLIELRAEDLGLTDFIPKDVLVSAGVSEEDFAEGLDALNQARDDLAMAQMEVGAGNSRHNTPPKSSRRSLPEITATATLKGSAKGGGVKRPSYHPKDFNRDGSVDDDDEEAWENMSQSERDAKRKDSSRKNTNIASQVVGFSKLPSSLKSRCHCGKKKAYFKCHFKKDKCPCGSGTKFHQCCAKSRGF